MDRLIRSDLEHAEALAELAEYMVSLRPVGLYPMWDEALRRLATHSRKKLLNDLSALTPVVGALGGAEALAELAEAIDDVGQWWP